MTATNRAAYIKGLRDLADAMEAHEEIPLPYGDQVRIMWHSSRGDAREGLAAAAQVLPVARWDKEVSGKLPEGYTPWFNLTGVLGGEGGLEIELTAPRDAVCTRVVKGTETREVEETVTPAVTRTVVREVEVVEWECGPLLAPRPAAELEPAGGTQ